MIDLEKARLIGTGHSRLCYLHPDDPTKVIKVPRDIGSGARQNRIDHYYLSRLERRGIPARHVPRQHDFVPTTMGPGLVLDLVADDGAPAPTLDSLLKSGRITRDQALACLEEVRTHFLEHGVVMVDIGLVNFVCRREGTRWVAVAIDGLGGRRDDLRLRVRTWFPVLARRKLRAQWEKVLWEVDACLATREAVPDGCS